MALVVGAERLARRLEIPQPLSEADRWLIEEAISDAQSDLEAYLGRPVHKATYTEQGLARGFDGKFTLRHFPVHSVTSSVEELDTSGRGTGLWTVTYVAGLDGESDPLLEPIRRFVLAHAIYSPTVQALFRRLNPDEARKVTNLSVEGQSVTYGDVYAVDAKASEAGLPGGLPSKGSCDQWRLSGRWVRQAPTRVAGPWPFDDSCYERRPGNWWA